MILLLKKQPIFPNLDNRYIFELAKSWSYVVHLNKIEK